MESYLKKTPESGSAKRHSQREVVLHSLYTSVGADELWLTALEHLAGYFNATSAMLVVAGEGQRTKSFYAAINVSEESAKLYSDYWWQHDLMLNTAVAKGLFKRGFVARSSDFLDPAVLRQSDYYRKYLRHLPAEHFLGCVLSDGSDPSLAPPMYLSLFRPPGAADFSDAELADLAGLYPHIHRAFELYWQSRQAREQLTVFHQSLDGLDFGVFFIDPANRVQHTNAAARRLVGQVASTTENGLTADAGTVSGLPALLRGQSDLANLVRSCALGQGGTLSLLSTLAGDSSAKRLVAVALPLNASNSSNTTKVSAVQAEKTGVTIPDSRGSVMLMLIDPLKRPDAAIGFVCSAFHLTKAEGRLLPLLFENHSIAEIAQKLEVKLSTVRSQLAAIFAKTGTARQQELIQLLGALPTVQTPKTLTKTI